MSASRRSSVTDHYNVIIVGTGAGGTRVLRRLGEPRATLGFFATLMTATLSLFPILGRTPPPWRWPKDVMATAVGMSSTSPRWPRRISSTGTDALGEPN